MLGEVKDVVHQQYGCEGGPNGGKGGKPCKQGACFAHMSYDSELIGFKVPHTHILAV